MGRRKHGYEREESRIVKDIIDTLPFRLQSEVTTEVNTLYGRIDIVINLSRPILVEVKVNHKDIKQALGQLLFYATCFSDPELFICCKERIPEQYLLIMDKHGIHDWRTHRNAYLNTL